MTDQDYRIQLEERCYKAEEGRTAWKWFALILLGILAYNQFKTHEEWTPDVDNNTITFTRTHFLWKTETHICQWRRDDDGDWGWCTRETGGSWYKFLQYAPDGEDESGD